MQRLHRHLRRIYRRIQAEREAVQAAAARAHIRTPAQIKDILDQYVIGQEDAKIALSVAVYNHYKRITTLELQDDVELTKSNVLLIALPAAEKL